MEISTANERKWPQIKVKGPESVADGGPISTDLRQLRSLVVKKSFRWINRSNQR